MSQKQLKKIAKHPGLDTALLKVESDINSTRKMLSVFCVIALIARFIFGIQIPVVVIILMFAWFLIYFLHERLVRKARNDREIYNTYFKQNIVDLFLLTLIIHFLGGAEWIGVMFYSLVLVTSGVILPKAKAKALGFFVFVFYSGLILLECFGVVPHRPLFLLEPGIYTSLPYVGIQILVTLGIFYFISETAGTFSEALKEKTEQLKKSFEKAEESRKVLEVRVEARTKELRELMDKQEETIEQRTKELQRKVKELEAFRKVAVGRELKMMELKKALREKSKE